MPYTCEESPEGGMINPREPLGALRPASLIYTAAKKKGGGRERRAHTPIHTQFFFI